MKIGKLYKTKKRLMVRLNSGVPLKHLAAGTPAMLLRLHHNNGKIPDTATVLIDGIYVDLMLKEIEEF